MNTLRNIFKLLVLFASTVVTINAEIKIINAINEARNELNIIDKQTLVIFDVDETLIMPKDKLLYKKNFHIAKPIFNIDTFIEAQIISQEKYKIVEKGILEIINDLKRKQIKIIALTLSGVGNYGVIKSLEEWRFSKMKEIGLDFQNKFFIDMSFNNLIELKKITINSKFPPMLYKGIILCNGIDKGIVLEEFLKRINWKPKKIIFFDDVLSNLQSVQTACEKLNIKFLGFHYLKAESIETKEDMNLNIIRFQIEHLKKTGKWISDEEFEKINQLNYRII